MRLSIPTLPESVHSILTLVCPFYPYPSLSILSLPESVISILTRVCRFSFYSLSSFVAFKILSQSDPNNLWLLIYSIKKLCFFNFAFKMIRHNEKDFIKLKTLNNLSNSYWLLLDSETRSLGLGTIPWAPLLIFWRVAKLYCLVLGCTIFSTFTREV